MTSNHLYNLMQQLVVEDKSLWRMKESYQSDSGDCPECQEFWKRMIADKESHVKELEELIKKHMQ